MPRTPPLGVPCAATRHIAARHASMGGTAIQIRKDVYNAQMSIRCAMLCYATVGRSVCRSRVAKKEGCGLVDTY
jgi:hypothetical protein